MKLLVVGGGGREHAIIKKLKENPTVTEIFAAPGNGGIASDATCVPIGATEIEKIVAFALENQIEAAKAQIEECEARITEAQRSREALAKSLGVEYSDEYMQMIKDQMSSYEQMANNYSAYEEAYNEAVTAWEQAKAALEAARGTASDEELAVLEQSVMSAEEKMKETRIAKETAASAEAKIGFWKQALKMDDYNNQITQLENIKADAEV